MRVVVPFAGTIHPIAAHALEDFAPGAERVDVSGDDFAYYDLLRDLWAMGEDFTVIEHDVAINPWALQRLESCGKPWCVAPYPIRLGLCRGGLGCTRFRGELSRRFPDLLGEGFERQRIGTWEPRYWQHLDYSLMVALTDVGIYWCSHMDTPVGHHHWDPEMGPPPGRCSCGSVVRAVCLGRRHHAGSLECGPDCVPTAPTSPPAPGTTTTPLRELLADAERKERGQREALERAQAAQRRSDLARWEHMAPQLAALEQAGRRCQEECLRNRRVRELNRWN